MLENQQFVLRWCCFRNSSVTTLENTARLGRIETPRQPRALRSSFTPVQESPNIAASTAATQSVTGPIAEQKQQAICQAI
jgi:hypothetical protein